VSKRRAVNWPYSCHHVDGEVVLELCQKELITRFREWRSLAFESNPFCQDHSCFDCQVPNLRMRDNWWAFHAVSHWTFVKVYRLTIIDMYWHISHFNYVWRGFVRQIGANLRVRNSRWAFPLLSNWTSVKVYRLTIVDMYWHINHFNYVWRGFVRQIGANLRVGDTRWTLHFCQTGLPWRRTDWPLSICTDISTILIIFGEVSWGAFYQCWWH
jgi:hypothetical protein